MLRGSGSGGDPEMGRLSVEDSVDDIKQALTNTDLLFIIAGLGKGTGSGASPEIAKIARSMGILTVAIVNLPSIHAEGQNIFKNALDSYEVLRKQVDSITTISNDKIIANSQNKISFIKAFEQANNEVANVISEIVDMIDNASEINIDFADIRNFFKTSPAFMANTISFNDAYSPSVLRTYIDNCMKNSCSDVVIKNDNTRVLASFVISANTAASIVADARAIFRGLASNSNLTLIPGIDYSGKDGVKLSFLISAVSQTLDSEQISQYDEIRNIPKHENEMDLIDIIATRPVVFDEYRTDKINNNKSQGVVRQSVTFDVTELEEISQQLDSREAAKIINKAMTNVIGDKGLVVKPDKDNN
jgi:cell division protein FtsZ